MGLPKLVIGCLLLFLLFSFATAQGAAGRKSTSSSRSKSSSATKTSTSSTKSSSTSTTKSTGSSSTQTTKSSSTKSSTTKPSTSTKSSTSSKKPKSTKTKSQASGSSHSTTSPASPTWPSSSNTSSHSSYKPASSSASTSHTSSHSSTVVYSDNETSGGDSSQEIDGTFVTIVIVGGVIVVVAGCAWCIYLNWSRIQDCIDSVHVSDITQPLLDKSSSSSNSTVSSTFSVDSQSWLPALDETQQAYDQTFVVTAEFSDQFRGWYEQYGEEYAMPPFTLRFFPDTNDIGLNIVQGYGTDLVGDFTMSGSYCASSGRLAMGKTYIMGTGDSEQNLGHTVKLRLHWNSQEQGFIGDYKVKTSEWKGYGRWRIFRAPIS